MTLLGQVDQLEVEGERTGHGPGPGDLEAAELVLEILALGTISGAGGNRPSPAPFHEPKEVDSLLFSDDLPEEGAQELDLAPERVTRPAAARKAGLGADRRIDADARGRHRSTRHSGDVCIVAR